MRASSRSSPRCPSPRAGNRRSPDWSADGRESPARRRDFRAQAIWSGNTAATRSSACIRRNCGGTFLPARNRGSASETPATQRQRVVNIGASSMAWISTCAHAVRMEVTRDVAELESCARGQRQHDIVFGRRRLQLEIELAAEALAQRQAPGAIDPAAERAWMTSCMPPASSKKRSSTMRVLRRQAAERGAAAAR